MRSIILGAIIFLQGCAAGYVKGDLNGYDASKAHINYCKKNDNKQYLLTIETDAKADYGNHPLGLASIFTLGVIPTYAVSFDTTTVYIADSGKEIYRDTYESTGHKFFGWFWIFLPETENSVAVNEGSGINIGWGVIRKSIARAIEELSDTHIINDENACFVLKD